MERNQDTVLEGQLMERTAGELVAGTRPPVKFTEAVRQTYLLELCRTGRKYHSAAYAGVCNETVRLNAERDPTLSDQIDAAMAIYKERVRREVTRRALEGWLEPTFGKDGQHMMFELDENGEIVMEEAEVPVRDKKGVPTGETRVVERPKMRPAFIRKYSDRMLELEAKRVDPAYRDKGSLDLNVRGGLLVVPGTAKTAEEWERGD